MGGLSFCPAEPRIIRYCRWKWFSHAEQILLPGGAQGRGWRGSREGCAGDRGYAEPEGHMYSTDRQLRLALAERRFMRVCVAGPKREGCDLHEAESVLGVLVFWLFCKFYCRNR